MGYYNPYQGKMTQKDLRTRLSTPEPTTMPEQRTTTEDVLAAGADIGGRGIKHWNKFQKGKLDKSGILTSKGLQYTDPVSGVNLSMFRPKQGLQLGRWGKRLEFRPEAYDFLAKGIEGEDTLAGIDTTTSQYKASLPKAVETPFETGYGPDKNLKWEMDIELLEHPTQETLGEMVWQTTANVVRLELMALNHKEAREDLIKDLKSCEWYILCDAKGQLSLKEV